MAKATIGQYREDIRTVNTNIVTDAAVLNTTFAAIRLGAYGAYYAQTNKLGLLVRAAYLQYNENNP